MGKKEITQSEAKALLKSGTIEIKLISNKTGKLYNANIVISEDGGVEINFNKKDGRYY